MESRSSRGIQEPQVWAAADLLLAEGLRPTIERVRQKIGSGSPNTVSPMLERWFATLGKRLGHSSGASAQGVAANGIPPALLQVAQQLWEAARVEAAKTQAQQAEAVRREIELKSAALDDQQAQLRQREVAFEHTRGSLESALASSRQALESVKGQLSEAARFQDSAQGEIRRLRESLAQTQSQLDAQRLEHRAAMAAREEGQREVEARHTAREHRLLGDIDRERLATHQAAAELAKEQKLRTRNEEEGALKLEAERVATRAAERLAEQLRTDVSEKAAELERLQSEIRSTKQANNETRARLAVEERAHQLTRDMLTSALTTNPKKRKPPAPPRTV
ncbi:DNA-binding protein [Variovorax sp. 770b2]|uniref:DNA-binding protein n=1 Tax=Variovorax sp. 770b2 TaxID=1566271 RepID=UPI0008E37400|nr:DNA-binding protein [Variovorax sp. 770b2]SFQ05321.1 replication region DNA-binding N-term [Variovorax sp. 770b2]